MPRAKIKGKQLKASGIDSYIVKDRSLTKDDLALNSFDGSMFIDGSIPASKLDPQVTKMGNEFNLPGKLVRLTDDGKLPPLDGSLLTNLHITEYISTKDLTDVEGDVNTANGLLKLDDDANLLLPNSLTISNTLFLNSISSEPLLSENQCALYYDGRLRFKTQGLNLKLDLIEVYNEIPEGSVNGINTQFLLQHEPEPGTERVYVNGLRETRNITYTINGRLITFSEPPSPGSIVVVDYKY